MDEQRMSLTIAAVSGVTLTKWTRAWEERRPDVPLIVIRVPPAEQSAVLHEARADVCFVRSLLDDRGLSVIPLYREAPVVVVPKDHPIESVDSVALADLTGQNLLTGDPADAVDLVAAGVGVLVVPQSIARLHARKDVVARPVTDAPDTAIALAWLADGGTELIEEFIGIVRGRTARSSRATPTPKAAKPARAPKAARSGSTKPGARRGTGRSGGRPRRTR